MLQVLAVAITSWYGRALGTFHHDLRVQKVISLTTCSIESIDWLHTVYPDVRTAVKPVQSEVNDSGSRASSEVAVIIVECRVKVMGEIDGALKRECSELNNVEKVTECFTVMM